MNQTCTQEFMEIVDWMVTNDIDFKDAVLIACQYQNSEASELCDILCAFLEDKVLCTSDELMQLEEDKKVNDLAEAIKKLREACMGK